MAQLDDWYADPNFNDDEELKKQAAELQAQLDAQRWQAQAKAYGVNTPTAPTYQDDQSDSGNYAPQPSAPQDTTQDARDRRQTIYTPQDFGGSSMQDDASDGGSRQTVYAPSDFERTADAQDRAQANQTHIYEPTVAPTYQDDQSDSGANTTIYQPTQDARDRQSTQKPQTSFYLQSPTQNDATNDWFGVKLPNAAQTDKTLGDVAQKISDSGAVDFAVGAVAPNLVSLYAGNQLRNKIAPDDTARLPLDAPETRLGKAQRQIINPQSSVKQIGEGLLSTTGELANFGANLVKAGMDKLAQAAPDLSGGQEYFRDGVTGMTAMNPKMVYEKGRQAEANANSAGVALDSKYIPADVTDKAQYAIDKTSSLMVSATHEQRVAAITRVLNGENPNVVVWGMDKPAETAFEDEKKAYATAVTDRLDAVSKIAYTNAINAGKTDLEAGKEAAYYREQEARKISANRRIDSEEHVVASALSSMLLDPFQVIIPTVSGKVFGTLVKEAKGITAGERMASVADEGAAAAVKAYTTGTPLWIAKAGESENVAAKAVAEVFENVGGLAKSTPAAQVAKYQESAYKVVGLVVNDAQSADEVAAALNGLAKNPDALVSRFGNISKSVDAEVARPILEATLEDLTSAARKYQTDKGFNAVGFMNEANDAFRTAAQSLVPAAERNAFENTALGVKGLLSKFQLRTTGYAMRNAMSDTAVAMLDGLDTLKSPKTVETGLQKWGITTSRIAESAGGISQDARAIASVGEKGLINKANELVDNIPGLKQIGNASQKFEAQRNKAAMLSALEQEMPKYWQPKLTPDEIAVLGERAPVIERELADAVTGKDLRRVLSTHAAADKPADALYIGHLMSDPTALPISTQKQIAADLSAAVKEGKSAEEAAAMIKAKYADEMTQTLNGKLLDVGEVYRPRINTKLEAGEDLSEAMLRERNLLRDSMVKSGAATPEEAEQMLNASIESYAKQERGAIAAREGMNQTARASNDPRMIDALHHTAMEEQAIRAEGRLETDRLLKEAYARIDEADANKASGAVKRGIWDDYNRANGAQLDEKFGRIDTLYKDHTAKIAAGELDGYSSAKSSLEQQLKAWEGELNTPELKGAWRDAADAGRKKIDTARADAWGTAKSIVEGDANLSQSAHDVMYRASEYEEIAARQATAKKANLKANMRAKEITFAQYNEQVGQVWTDHFAQVEQRYQIAAKELKAVEVVEGNIAPKLAELGYPPEEVQRMIANMKTGDGVPEIVNILESKTSFDPTKSLPKWKGGEMNPPETIDDLLKGGRFDSPQDALDYANAAKSKLARAPEAEGQVKQWDNLAYQAQQKVDEAAGVTHEQAALRNAVKQTAENESIYEAAQMANNAPPETRAILKQTVADAAQRSAANSLAATDDIDKGLNAAVQAHAEAYFGHSGSEPYLWNSIKAYQEENGIKVIAGLEREANIETLRAFSKDLNLDPSKLVNASERSTSEIIAAARKAHPEAVDAVLAAPKTRNGTITTKAWKELEAQGLVVGKPQSAGEFLKTLAPEAFRSEITADDAIKATVRATFEHNMNPAEMPDLVTHTERKARKALDEIAQGVSNPDFWDKRYTPVANREQTISNLMSRLEPELNSARHMAINVAERRTGYSMLNYSDKRNFDTLISMVSPYSYWGLRQQRNTVFRVLENPMLVANYARVRDAEKRALKESGMRQRLEGMMPVLNTDVGRVFVNVVDPILPFSDLIKDVYDDPNEQKTWQQSVYDYLQMTGLAPGSHVDTPIRALNLLVSAKAGTPKYDKQVAEYGSESVRSPLPQIGMVTAATVLAGVGGVGGVDLDQMARQKMGLPEAAGFTAYRTMRALSDMAATEQGAPTFNKRTYYLAEALVDRNQKTGWIALQKTMTPKDVAKQLNISEPEAAAALDLARKAIEIETKQTAIRTLGSGVFGFKTQVQTQGEELRNQQQRDERAAAYDPLTGYGSRKELIDFRDRNPTSDISRGQYAVLPGEDGDPMRSYFRDVQNEASKAFDTLKDETIKRNPADRNAGYAIDAAKKYALSQIGNDKNTEPFNWQDVLNQAKSGKWTPPTTTTGQANASDAYTPRSVYGATPQETAQIRFNEAVREIASTEPKREKFVRADGSVDYEAFKAADKSWKEDVTHIASTNDTIKQIVEQAGKDNPYAAELLKTKLASLSYGDVQKYFQQYDTPLEAMQRAYNDTVYGGAMDAYAKTKDSDPRAYNKTVGAVKTMSDKELAALVQGVYQGRWTDAELQDALKGVSMPALKDVITANLPKDKQEARQMSDKFYELRDKLMPPGKGAAGFYDDPVIAALMDGQANDYATTEEYRQGIQRLIVLNKKYGTGERTPAWDAAEASNDKLKAALTQKYGDGWQQLWQDYGKAKAGAERAQLIAKNPQLQGLITDRAKWEAAYPEWADYYGKNAKSTAQGSTSYSSGSGGTGGVVGESGKRYANTPQGQLEKLADEKLPKNAAILNDPDVKAALGSATGKYATASQIAAAQQKITAWAQQNAGDYGAAKKQSQTINTQLQKQFGEDINLLYQYDAMSAKDASAFYKAHPEISAMLDARNQLGAQNAEYQKYFLSGNSGSTTTRTSGGGGGGGRAPSTPTATAKTPRIYAPSDLVGTSQATSKQNTSSGAKSNSTKAPTIYMPGTAKTGSAPTPADGTSTENQQKSDAWKELKAIMDDVVPSGESGKEAKQIPIVSIVLGSTRANTQLNQYYQAIDAIKSWANANGTDDPSGAWQRAKGQAAALDKLLRSKYGDDSVALLYQYDTAKSATARINVAKQYPVVNELVAMRVKFGAANKEYAYYYLGGDKPTGKAPMPAGATSGTATKTGQTANEKWAALNAMLKAQYEMQSKIKTPAPPPKLANAGKYQGGAAKISGVYG